MTLERALARDTKWEDSNRKDKSELMKAMGYPSKVPAYADIGTLQNLSDCDVGLLRQYLLHQELV